MTHKSHDGIWNFSTTSEINYLHYDACKTIYRMTIDRQWTRCTLCVHNTSVERVQDVYGHNNLQTSEAVRFCLIRLAINIKCIMETLQCSTSSHSSCSSVGGGSILLMC